MKIVFVLPKFSRYPIGGYKMVYEYANRLAKFGNSVRVLHVNNSLMKKYHLPKSIRIVLANSITKKGPSWITNEGFDIHSVFEPIVEEDFLEADVAIATAVETVSVVQNYFRCRKVYFIQGLENWNVTENELYTTYRNEMKKIVISRWLKQIVDGYSPEESVLINNPIDLTKYNVRNPFSNRNRYSVAIMFNEQPVKGFKYSLEAIHRIKVKYPELIVNMFGRMAYPNKLPKWIHYTENASQQETIEIYNNSRIYLCGSIEEGYGLTGLEAMACGCILVSTDFLGAREYAIDKYNSLLSPIKNIQGLVNNIELAIEDDRLGSEIVSNALQDVKRFSWDKSLGKFIDALGN